MSYPFWEKNRADRESSKAFEARREADKSKKELESVEVEIKKYKSTESDKYTKEELIEILEKISKILSK